MTALPELKRYLVRHDDSYEVSAGVPTSSDDFTDMYYLASDVDALLAELGRDAVRYKWLRRNDITSQAGVYSDDDCNHWLTETLLDAVIDAEMAAHAAGKSTIGVAWPLIDAAMKANT